MVNLNFQDHIENCLNYLLILDFLKLVKNNKKPCFLFKTKT